MRTLKQVLNAIDSVDRFNDNEIKLIRYARQLNMSPKILTLLLNKISPSDNNMEILYNYIEKFANIPDSRMHTVNIILNNYKSF